MRVMAWTPIFKDLFYQDGADATQYGQQVNKKKQCQQRRRGVRVWEWSGWLHGHERYMRK